MTSTWSPCKIGKPLYEAYECEAKKARAVGEYTADSDRQLVLTWNAWVTHRDNCERCKVTK